MNKVAALVGLAIAGIALWWFMQRAPSGASSPPASSTPGAAGSSPGGAGSSPAGAGTTGAGSAAAPSRGNAVDRVGKVTREERDRLAGRIANARAGRAATAGRTVPTLPEAQEQDATLVRTTMKAAMREVIPFLAECYQAGGSALPPEIEVVVDMTLTGDPDIGTIIDTNGVADGNGAPLQAAFDLCLRDALASLQMPPLSEGGEVKVTYPFVFAINPEAAGSGSAAR